MTSPTLCPGITALARNLIREVSVYGQGFSDVVPMWFGESDQDTPSVIVEKAVEALRGGVHRYQPNQGHGPLLDALEAYMADLYQPIARDRIMVTVGGMNGLMASAQAVVSPGNKVVAIEPYWPNLTAIAEICGARVETSALTLRDNRWTLDLNHLLSLIDAGTDAVLLNAPSNPTGWVATIEEMQALLDHCRQTGTWIISDEVYSRLWYGEGRRAPSMLDVATDSDRVLVVNSFSKAWTMTGWRLGWVVVPSGTMGDFCKLNEFNVAGPVAFAQAAAVAALQTESVVDELMQRCRENRALVTARLRAMPGITLPEIDGAFYAFFHVAGVTDSLELAKALIREAGVGLAPGSAFGPAGQGWLRLCFAQDPARIAAALDRIEAHLAHIAEPA